jgi:hypothetical protein
MGDLDVKVKGEGSPVRCPYCHEDVFRDKEAWVACEACLARHHSGCWQEANRCGGCGGASFLTREAPPRAKLWQDTAPADEVPYTEVELRGRRAHFELDTQPLQLVGRDGVDEEPFEVRVKNDTGLPQRVEVRRLPPWIVARGETAYEVPAGATARFQLVYRVADAPREMLTKGSSRRAMSMGAGGYSTGALVLSCDDDSATLELSALHAHTRAQRLAFTLLLSTVGLHVGLIFYIIMLVKTWTAPTAARHPDPRDLLLRRRVHDQNLAFRRALSKGIGLTLGLIATILLVAAIVGLAR